ncbi:MAG TPA: M50 family metallopeptidase [Kouleothrix sp.]|uniref:M50 family metallopeptidase n=1 Tax=Kouleothrix sp. TaxID=2779161 RepID=UPI002B882C84|nr:M50 family metallopeptidase [Kouleothrix sp.]HRC74365.1 M50 family metallopeptidase [Kouleothrix sp.]
MFARAFTIGRVAGIPIRCHWSWLAMLAFVAAMLHWLYLPSAGGALGAWVLATLAAVLLWASVLLHELGHALVARQYGLRVGGITLFALGGATEIGDGPANPVRDMLVALAGPLISLALALLFAVAWWLWPAQRLALLVLHLALSNGAMAIFNLLPGYPLDGGRVLWAVLSYLSDDELGAARVGAFVGRACGWVLLTAGLLYALGAGDVVSGAWMGLIGYFLVRSATLGHRRFVVQRMLSNVQVSDLMQRAFRAVAPELPLDQFVGSYVLSQVDQGFPVLQIPEADAPQPLLGMITVHNLRRFQFHEWAGTRVGEAMTPIHRLRLLAPEMPAGEAFRTLLESGEEQLPVIDGALLLGVLRRRDLVGYIERKRQAHG